MPTANITRNFDHKQLFFECQWQTCKIKQALETSQLQLSSGVDQLAPVSTAAVAAGSADQSSI